MPRKLWGTLVTSDDDKTLKQMVSDEIKKSKVEKSKNSALVAIPKTIKLKVKNALVTQTIEAMKQTEMLQSLIETFSNKSGSSNCLLNPCEIIPDVDFPRENSAHFQTDEKFIKPIWFIPPLKTDFSEGVPQRYAKMDNNVARALVRKAVCGQMRVAGFTDTAETALTLFVHSVEEFVRNLLQQMRENLNSSEEPDPVPNVETFEKAYMALTNSSVTKVHNHFKHYLVKRNANEIQEFNFALQEYEKLRKESHNLHELKEDTFLNMPLSSLANPPAIKTEFKAPTSSDNFGVESGFENPPSLQVKEPL